MTSEDDRSFKDNAEDFDDYDMSSSQSATYRMMNDIFPKESGLGSFMEVVTRHWIGYGN